MSNHISNKHNTNDYKVMKVKETNIVYNDISGDNPDDVFGGGAGMTIPIDPIGNPPIDTPPGTPEYSTEQQSLMTSLSGVSFDAVGNLLNTEGTVILPASQVKEEIDKLKDNGEPTLTNEQKEYLTKYEGTSFDDKGNILGADGSIVKTAEEIKTDNPEEKFDAQNNLIDADGKIIKTAEQYTTDKLNAENADYFNTFPAAVGIEVIDNATGKPKVYDHTNEGVMEYIADSITVSNNVATSEAYTALPEIVKELNTWVSKGLKAEDFFKEETDYSAIEIDKENKDQMKNLVIAHQRALGNTKNGAEKIAGYSESADKLFEDAEEALAALKVSDGNTKAAKIANADKIASDNKIANQQFWNGVSTKINKGEIGGVKIPIASRKPFLDYISSRDAKGHTKADYDMNKLTEEDKIVMDYIFGFKGKSPANIIEEMLGHVQAGKTMNGFKKREAAEKNRGGMNPGITQKRDSKDSYGTVDEVLSL